MGNGFFKNLNDILGAYKEFKSYTNNDTLKKATSYVEEVLTKANNDEDLVALSLNVSRFKAGIIVKADDPVIAKHFSYLGDGKNERVGFYTVYRNNDVYLFENNDNVNDDNELKEVIGSLLASALDY